MYYKKKISDLHDDGSELQTHNNSKYAHYTRAMNPEVITGYIAQYEYN